MENIKTIVANNLLALRKANNLTQLEFAEKINYSDKAISRWEKAEVVPDVETLNKIANIYGVSLTLLLTENAENTIKKVANPQIVNKFAFAFSLISVVWAIFTIAYVYLQLIKDINCWQLFVWAVPTTSILIMVFNSKWGTRKFGPYIDSIFIWSFIASIYLQFLQFNLALVFIIGIPLQAGIIFASLIKPIEK